MNVAILLDGDFTRRLLNRRLGHIPTVVELEAFCRSMLLPGEVLQVTLFYDSPPFDEKRDLPISHRILDFRTTRVFARASAFQEDMRKNPFFVLRLGHLSFDGWAIKETSVQRLARSPGALSDADFVPVLSQKQVDMKIGLDVARLSLGGTIGRMLLATSDADFIPAIHAALAHHVEVVLMTDVVALRRTKGILLKAFSSHRIVQGLK